MPSSSSIWPTQGTCDPASVLRPVARLPAWKTANARPIRRPFHLQGSSVDGKQPGGPGREDAGGAAASSGGAGRRAPLELRVLGSCLDFIPEPQLQAHVGAVPWEVLTRRGSFPPEKLGPGEDQGETIRPSRTGPRPRPPTLPGGLFSALVVLSLLPPLMTAGSNQSRFTSQGGVERNRGS